MLASNIIIWFRVQGFGFWGFGSLGLETTTIRIHCLCLTCRWAEGIGFGAWGSPEPETVGFHVLHQEDGDTNRPRPTKYP